MKVLLSMPRRNKHEWCNVYDPVQSFSQKTCLFINCVFTLLCTMWASVLTTKIPSLANSHINVFFFPRRLSVLPPHKCHSHPCQLELFQYDLLCRHNIRFYWQNPDVSGLRHICVPSHTIWETLLWMHEKVMRISYLPLLNTHEDVMIYKCMPISSTEGTIIS